MSDDTVVETKKPDKVVKFLLVLLGFFVVVILAEVGYYLFTKYSPIPVKISGGINGYSVQVGDNDTFNNLLKETGFGSPSDKKYYDWEKIEWQNFSNVAVTLTQEPQKWGRVVGAQNEVLSSFGQEFDKGNLRLKIYISPDYTEKERLTYALIVALSRALMMSKNPDFWTNEEISTKTNEMIKRYIETSPRPIEVSKNGSNLLRYILSFFEKNNPFKVGRALAACTGFFECGTSTTQLRCTITGTSCDYIGQPCVGGGVCFNDTVCPADTSGGSISCGNYLNCSPSCSSSECVVDGSNSCSISGGGPTPTPSPGGTTECGTQTCDNDTQVCCSTGCKPIADGCTTATPPPPSGITMQVVVGLDKNRNGVFDDGYYQVIEDPGDVNCGTFPNISGLAINYSGAATGSINYHTNCAGGAYNYPYSAQGISASGNFTFALANLPSNYTLKWIEEGTGKCTLSGGTVTCTGLVSGQTYGLWFFLQEAPTCTVQGYKVVMPGNQNIAPANSQTVTLNDPLTSTSTQPYFLFYQSASKTRTVSVSVPANYTVGYTLCYNNTACHTSAPVMSSSVNLPDNSFCGSSNGYADLWWHYYPPPSCTISFNSPNYSMSVGSSQTAGTNVTFSNGTISSVNFASSNTGIATVNPASDTTSSYTTNITGVSGGSATVTANVIMSGVSRCSATTAVSVTSNPWWQVKDSDVATNQDLRSTIPPGQLFGKNGDGGYPGVAVYGTSTNLTKPNVSATGWLVNTTYSTSKIYDSNYFVNSIPGDAVINPVSSSSVAGSFFASGGTAYNGYYWYVYDGSAMGGIPLTISSAANLGARKIILIVKGANLSIKGNIKLTKGSGFFLAVAGENTAGSYGNIIVDPGVGGGGSANLEGIYVADGTFSSGTGGTSQLWVRGTVAAYGGMNLQRDLGSATNTTTPAEYFEYAPDQELLFPVDLAYSLTTWREVAP